jgi:hypothetical protein
MTEISETGAQALVRAVADMEAALGDTAAITAKAMKALRVIVDAVERHTASGQAKIMVQFLAGLYNGCDYKVDLTSLRSLDVPLANACLNYLNYDRLGKTEVHEHLPNGARDLHRWIEYTGVVRSPRVTRRRKSLRRRTSE